MILRPRLVLERDGLGSSLFARHYWGNRCFFLFLRVLRCFSSPGSPRHIDGTGSSIQWVAPFGHVRIKPCLRVPGLFRSLPRPSSPAEAKASSVRPCFSFSLSESLRFVKLSNYYYNSLISFITLPRCDLSVLSKIFDLLQIPNPLDPPVRGTFGASRRAGKAGLEGTLKERSARFRMGFRIS